MFSGWQVSFWFFFKAQTCLFWVGFGQQSSGWEGKCSYSDEDAVLEIHFAMKNQKSRENHLLKEWGKMGKELGQCWDIYEVWAQEKKTR